MEAKDSVTTTSTNASTSLAAAHPLPSPSGTLHPSPPSPLSNASLLLDPAFHAVAPIASCTPLEDASTEFGELFDELQSLARSVAAGDTTHPESLATTQATVLNIMFARLSSMAMTDIQHPQFASLLGLALRAQAQSARTLKTLASIKRPAVFTQQLNLAHQQVVQNTPRNSDPTPMNHEP